MGKDHGSTNHLRQIAEGWDDSLQVLPSLPSKSDPFYLLLYIINII